jgi:hypothetical protein
MISVVAIHGIGNQYSGETTMHSVWFPALPDGMLRAGYDLRPPPANGIGHWPGTVTRWTNVADRGDVVALVKRLAPQFGDRVRSIEIDCGSKAHDNTATVTARQTRSVVGRLIAAGHWRPRDPDILLVADVGYDGPRLAHVLADLPITVLVRMRTDRVLHRPALAPAAGTLGRPAAAETSSPSATQPPGGNPTSSPTSPPGSTAPH